MRASRSKRRSAPSSPKAFRLEDLHRDEALASTDPRPRTRLPWRRGRSADRACSVRRSSVPPAASAPAPNHRPGRSRRRDRTPFRTRGHSRITWTALRSSRLSTSCLIRRSSPTSLRSVGVLDGHRDLPGHGAQQLSIVRAVRLFRALRAERACVPISLRS